MYDKLIAEIKKPKHSALNKNAPMISSKPLYSLSLKPLTIKKMTKKYNARGRVIKRYNLVERIKMAINHAIRQHRLDQKDFMQT